MIEELHITCIILIAFGDHDTHVFKLAKIHDENESLFICSCATIPQNCPPTFTYLMRLCKNVPNTKQNILKHQKRKAIMSLRIWTIWRNYDNCRNKLFYVLHLSINKVLFYCGMKLKHMIHVFNADNYVCWIKVEQIVVFFVIQTGNITYIQTLSIWTNYWYVVIVGTSWVTKVLSGVEKRTAKYYSLFSI